MSVSTLEVADDVGLKAAVTPLGMPDAVKATMPVNPPVSATVIVSVALLPCVTVSVGAEGLRLKPDVVLRVTLTAMLTEALKVPEVPVMVTVEELAGAVLLAVNVSTQLPFPAIGVVQPETLTPLGMPVTVLIVTVPVKPPVSVTVIVSVPLEPAMIESAVAEALSVKPPAVEGPTVSVMEVVAGISAPEVPVMVIVELP